MSTHRHIDKICCLALVIVLLITAVLVHAGSSQTQTSPQNMQYESRLFDTSKVHTIDILMDDWEGFLETCENEEYTVCSLVIDDEPYKNIGLRAKGNTSLSNVAAYGNDRYSFKVEFDHYDNSKSYYGLDKISLNNLIQDNTCMKDYLTYQMMGGFGVSTPLCSYAYITVNGKDWGLYLAVEGVEESFLKRNYGNNYGNLYKPDSMDMGGGRGNGEGFRMEDFQGEAQEKSSLSEQDSDTNKNFPENGAPPQQNFKNDSDFMPGNFPSEESFEAPRQGSEPLQQGSESPEQDFESSEQDSVFPEQSFEPPQQDSESSEQSFEAPRQGSESSEQSFEPPQQGFEKNTGFPGDDRMKGGMMGSDDVSLIYSDDKYESYSSIFDNAKTNINDTDKDRLIAALKALNKGESLETCVDIEAVIRYFTVHNFVCNFDSYTGSMIHNYYLYEKDGQLSMIPWDYNLAFGGFEASASAESLVNYPIDTPVSGGSVDSRPMLAWIFANEEYTELYHELFQEFLALYFDSGYIDNLISSTAELIRPYIEKDPTSFCTCEEFDTGVSALKEFCALRAQSIQGQLDGSIPSTTDGQSEDSSSLIAASELTISDMGSMSQGGHPMDGNPMGGNPAGGNPMGGNPVGGNPADNNPMDGNSMDGNSMDDSSANHTV